MGQIQWLVGVGRHRLLYQGGIRFVQTFSIGAAIARPDRKNAGKRKMFRSFSPAPWIAYGEQGKYLAFSPDIHIRLLPPTIIRFSDIELFFPFAKL